MKVKHKKILKPLIKLHFLKNQVYKKAFDTKCLTNLTLHLKQLLKIIYLYNKKNKKILFLGFSESQFIKNQINHVFCSKQMYLKKKLNYKQFDLIVYNYTTIKDLMFWKNLKKLNVPVVILGNSDKENYYLNISTKKRKNFNLFIIFSVLTKYVK